MAGPRIIQNLTPCLVHRLAQMQIVTYLFVVALGMLSLDAIGQAKSSFPYVTLSYGPGNAGTWGYLAKCILVGFF